MRLDMTDVDPSKLDGPDRPQPCGAHFEVLAIQEFDPKSGAMHADCEVLAADVADQEGKVHREYFSLSQASQGRVAQFAVALGLATNAGLAECKAKGVDPDIHFEPEAVGRQFAGRLVEEEYNGKKRCKLNFNIWALDDPRAKGIPINRAKLRHDEPFSTPPAGGNGNGANQAAAPPAAEDPPFDGSDLFS